MSPTSSSECIGSGSRLAALASRILAKAVQAAETVDIYYFLDVFDKLTMAHADGKDVRPNQAEYIPLQLTSFFAAATRTAVERSTTVMQRV